MKNLILSILKEKHLLWIIWSSIILFVSIILFISSIFHRLLLDSTTYTKSFLIHIEMITCTFSLLFHILNLILLLTLLFKKKLKLLFHSFIIAVISFVLTFWSFVIDSPTLIYMT